MDEYLNMNCNNIIKNNNIINSYVIITAFFDIGRENWSVLSRTPNTYIGAFKKLLDFNKKMVIFIDDRYIDKIFVKDINKIFIPINIEWLNLNCESWKKNNISKSIMKSEKYIQYTNTRILGGSPENIYSEYNTVNHSKIDFIKFAIDTNLVKSTELLCWCDFGYYNSILGNITPNSGLDINMFNLNKMNFCLYSKIKKIDEDMLYTLLHAPVTFTGSFFAGSIENMLELHKLYHICLDELYSNNISDDDQHIYLRCYLKNKKLFQLWLSEGIWPKSLIYFQKKFENRNDLIQHYIHDIDYGRFVEIGVCHGTLSKFILNSNTSCKLYCVDPYISYDDFDDACNNEVGDKLYLFTKNNLTTLFNDRVEFIRNFSHDAINLIDDNLDFIYIDGNHKYKYILQDLELWYAKLKKGGIIICDDAVDIDDSKRDSNGDIFIEWGPGSYGKYGVFHACKYFTNIQNISYYKFKEQILIFKPFY